jgi:uncharacterized DUF497 family protein
MKIWEEPVEFDWDGGNIGKNLKHNVEDKEAEETFKNESEFVFRDEMHSLSEDRYMLWGITNRGRKLSIFFTIRENKVRIISARDMTNKERKEYEKKIQENT